MAQQLVRTYARHNRKYFSGKLPKIPVIWSRHIPQDCVAWYTPIGGENGSIMLDSRMRKWSSVWQMCLLHEMCHVKLRDHPAEARSGNSKHCKEWISEMRRLARLGAFDAIW